MCDIEVNCVKSLIFTLVIEDDHVEVSRSGRFSTPFGTTAAKCSSSVVASQTLNIQQGDGTLIAIASAPEGSGLTNSLSVSLSVGSSNFTTSSTFSLATTFTEAPVNPFTEIPPNPFTKIPLNSFTKILTNPFAYPYPYTKVTMNLHPHTQVQGSHPTPTIYLKTARLHLLSW